MILLLLGLAVIFFSMYVFNSQFSYLFMHWILGFNSFNMGNRRNRERKYDCTRTDEEEKKEIKRENMRKLREKRAMERNVEAHGSDVEMKNVNPEHGDDEEMKNVNLEHGGDEGMQIVEEHVDEINEEHGGDKEMTNVEQTMGSVDIETMIGE